VADYPIKSKKAEERVLRAGLGDETRFRDIVGLTDDGFEFYHELASNLCRFWEKHHVAPDPDAFQAWCPDPVALDQLSHVLQTVAADVDERRYPVYVDILREGRIARGMLVVADDLASRIGSVPHPKLLRDVHQRLTDMLTATSERAETTRSFYWEDSLDRWERFKAVSANPESLRGIPFGIRRLDQFTGGLHRTEKNADLISLFGKSGSQKSRLLFNLAYNHAAAGYPGMLVTREMSRENVGMLLDARESLNPDHTGSTIKLPFQQIRDAYLVGKFRKRYKNLLKNQYENMRYPLWIVDAPDVITPADLLYEIEVYRAETGSYPAYMYVDYANLLEPVGRYDTESQKYDKLFLELLGICKGFSIPIVTAVRESRIGSLRRERDEIGQEHVGLSQAIVYHLVQLWHVDATKDDIAENRLWLRAKKNRYGELFELDLFSAYEYAYIGDREVESGYDDL